MFVFQRISINRFSAGGQGGGDIVGESLAVFQAQIADGDAHGGLFAGVEGGAALHGPAFGGEKLDQLRFVGHVQPNVHAFAVAAGHADAAFGEAGDEVLAAGLVAFGDGGQALCAELLPELEGEVLQKFADPAGA